jgi:hypothetical protein
MSVVKERKISGSKAKECIVTKIRKTRSGSDKIANEENWRYKNKGAMDLCTSPVSTSDHDKAGTGAVLGAVIFGADGAPDLGQKRCIPGLRLCRSECLE